MKFIFSIRLLALIPPLPKTKAFLEEPLPFNNFRAGLHKNDSVTFPDFPSFFPTPALLFTFYRSAVHVICDKDYNDWDRFELFAARIQHFS